MNRYLTDIAVTVVFTFASLALAADASAGQYLLFKGKNVTRSCLDGLIQAPVQDPVSAQPLLFSCYQVAYEETDTLVYDQNSTFCMTYADFAATTDADIEDAFIPYTSTRGSLQKLLDSLFIADMNAVVSFDSPTGQVLQGESTICAEGTTSPPPPPEVIKNGAFLKASNTYFSDFFGTSVAISGNTVVVGAPGENSDLNGIRSDETSEFVDSGAAYVFVYKGGVWSQQAFLKASNAYFGDEFGKSVAISGDTLVVGAWLEDSGVTGDQTDNSRGESGAAFVFVRNGDTWTQQAYLKSPSPDANDVFGASLAIDGETIVVSAFSEDSNATGIDGDPSDNSTAHSGAAYVFVRNGDAWTQQAYLKAPFQNIAALFGSSVAISGDTVVVGSRRESSDATGVDGAGGDNDLAKQSGAAFVFSREAGNWSQQAYLKASNTDAYDEFGASVAISGDTLVVGALFEDSLATGVNGDQIDIGNYNTGAAYVFGRNAGVWSQQAYLKASNSGQSDWFGHSVALFGNTLIVGALQERSNATGVNGDQNTNSLSNAGAAYVFERNAGVWGQRAYLKASNTGAFDEFGVSAAVSDGVFVVGAHTERSDSTGIDGPDNDLMSGAGAAYVILLHKEIVIDLPPGPITPGSIFTVTAIGFKPNTLVKAFLQSEPVLVGEEMSDADGKVIFEIIVPLDFPPGDHSLILLGVNPDDTERQLTEPLSILSQGAIFNDGFE